MIGIFNVHAWVFGKVDKEKKTFLLRVGTPPLQKIPVTLLEVSLSLVHT